MDNQNHNAQSVFEQLAAALKQIDKQIDEWVSFFIDQLENANQ